jgi:hypothetical protein
VIGPIPAVPDWATLNFSFAHPLRIEGATMDMQLPTGRDAERFRQAVGVVGLERIYIRLTDAPEATNALAFVRSNIESGNPQCIADHDGEIVGWCDIVRQD